jgi:hypothetical protein
MPGLLSEMVLPDPICAEILLITVEVTVNHIVAVCMTQIPTEFKPQSLGMLAQEHFGTCASCALDTALLTGTYADCLFIISKTDRIGLRILQHTVQQ